MKKENKMYFTLNYMNEFELIYDEKNDDEKYLMMALMNEEGFYHHYNYGYDNYISYSFGKLNNYNEKSVLIAKTKKRFENLGIKEMKSLEFHKMYKNKKRKIMKEVPLKFDNKEDIENWLKAMKVNNYIINDDLEVEVFNNVNLSSKQLYHIPFQFSKVHGYFHINDNNLVNLKGCPFIVYDEFSANYNKLTSLKNIPTILLSTDKKKKKKDNYRKVYMNNNNLKVIDIENVNNDIDSLHIKNNKLTSLKNVSNFQNLKELIITNNKIENLNELNIDNLKILCVSNNKLTSLEGCPQNLESLKCFKNKLTTMLGCPNNLLILECNNNLLTNFEGFPEGEVMRNIRFYGNNIHESELANFKSRFLIKKNHNSVYSDFNKIGDTESFKMKYEQILLSSITKDTKSVIKVKKL